PEGRRPGRALAAGAVDARVRGRGRRTRDGVVPQEDRAMSTVAGREEHRPGAVAEPGAPGMDPGGQRESPTGGGVREGALMDRGGGDGARTESGGRDGSRTDRGGRDGSRTDRGGRNG